MNAAIVDTDVVSMLFKGDTRALTTGRVFAASPRSANHTSPGCGFIEQVQNFLFGSARAHQVEDVVVGEIDDFRDALSHLGGRLRLPLAQPRVQLLYQSVHEASYR
jgi:hypothetical protein